MNLAIAVYTALFSVVNPLGAIPIFLTLTAGDSDQVRNKQALKACIYFCGILVSFLFLGAFILSFFGITIEAMKIAGGFIIIRSGYHLMDATYRKGKALSENVEKEGLEKDDISFSPLAMPMLSGPGSISLLLSIAAENSNNGSYLSILAAILLVGLTIYVIFRFSPLMIKMLGQGGISALSRIMGFIVMTIGIQYIISGITPLLKNIVTASTGG